MSATAEPLGNPAARSIDQAAEHARQELEDSAGGRHGHLRDVGVDRLLELELEDRNPPGSAALEYHLGRRGGGGDIEVRLRDHAGRHVGVRISEAELRAIAFLSTAALGWTMRPPAAGPDESNPDDDSGGGGA